MCMELNGRQIKLKKKKGSNITSSFKDKNKEAYHTFKALVAPGNITLLAYWKQVVLQHYMLQQPEKSIKIIVCRIHKTVHIPKESSKHICRFC